MTDHLTVSSHAKVNLFLRVLAREADGYHAIETLFCRIGLHDTLEIKRTAAGITLEVDGANLGAPEKNLVWRAADAVLTATGKNFGVAIKLTKRIPVGGGLGGGSSNAAATLRGVNALADNRVPVAELYNIGARLGADVPFFLTDAGLALAWGHGQRLLRLPVLPEKPMIVVAPPFGVSTAEAYRWIDSAPASERGGLALDLTSLSDWGGVSRMAGNDFETVVFGQAPALRAAYEALAVTRPLMCRMSGSGSSLFAIYRNATDRDDAISRIGTKHGIVISTTACGGEI